jgi:hypothetical protein
MLQNHINSKLTKPLKPNQIRRLSKEMQGKIWRERGKLAVEIFKNNKYIDDVPDIVDDIR